MATLEDIVAATKILSDDPDSEMGVSDSKPEEDQTRVSFLRKCDGGSDPDVVVNEQVVQSEVIVESTIDVNGPKGELVKTCNETNEIGENSLEETKECESTGDKQLNGSGTDVMDVDGDGCDEGTGEKNDEDKGFLVGDFVWGKIKSHPWWPGQVYDPKDASEFAMTRKQEGRLLVAFFGDGSCSWCSPSQMIPFVDNFSEMSRDSCSKSFLNAVQRATDEVGRLMELEMTCKCIPEEKKDSLAKPEVTNAGLRAGVIMPEVDVCRLSFPKFEPANVLDKVMQLAKVVSVGNALDVAVLRSWLSAFYYFKGGHVLPVYHGPFDIEGLEDKNRDVNGAADDFSVPIEVPILGPQDDDWLSSPTARSVNSQAPSESKVLHKRKQRSVAELMGENKNTKADSRKLLASVKEGSDVEKSRTTRKRKKDSDGELKGAGSEQPSSTGKRGRNRKAEVMITDDSSVGANGGKSSRRPKEIDVSATENDASEARYDSETVSTPRERKKSKYLSPPYTNLAWRLGNSSFKSEAQVENGEAPKTDEAGERSEDRDIATSQTILKSVDNGPTGSVSTSVDNGTLAVKAGKKLSFSVSDVDVPVNELLLDIQHAALDPFHLSKKGSLDMVWAFVSVLRSSTYLHGADYKIYLKRKTGGNRKSLPSQIRDVSNEVIEEKTAKSPDQNTPRSSKTPKNSKKSAQAAVESEQVKTRPCLSLAFTPGFPLPSKKEVVGMFGKFGSLNMKETRVEKDSNSIRIVYMKESDAEAALKSSSSRCPFGSGNVSYALQRSPAGSKSRRSHPKVPPPETRVAEDLVSDLNTIKRKLEITTAIVENYHSKFSSEDKSGLKDEMKHLMEKMETVGDMVRVIAEKSTS
ncbi:PWWP domain-containing protein 3-like [Salvia miltiorrhiza]|uniref:PWWP domain-containing protein 3-like n=1 Tax=Salvia miltiorrhiza TaxID=226208 RepID=UPI0025AD3D3A|nr:PWWP domain-containing protein 3-like [Salvia miltiorrhiza]